jgi:hypothetical protein
MKSVYWILLTIGVFVGIIILVMLFLKRRAREKASVIAETEVGGGKNSLFKVNDIVIVLGQNKKTTKNAQIETVNKDGTYTIIYFPGLVDREFHVSESRLTTGSIYDID